MRALQAPVIVFIIVIRIQNSAFAISLHSPVEHNSNKNTILPAPVEHRAASVPIIALGDGREL